MSAWMSDVCALWWLCLWDVHVARAYTHINYFHFP